MPRNQAYATRAQQTEEDVVFNQNLHFLYVVKHNLFKKPLVLAAPLGLLE